MNKDNAKDYLPLVQALADGKTIQENNFTRVPPALYEWLDLKEPIFNRPIDCYRIKPEPRTFDMWINKITTEMKPVTTPVTRDDWERITVQEVLK